MKNGKPFDYTDHYNEDYGFIRNDCKIMGDLWLGDEEAYRKQIRVSYTNA